MGHRCTNCGFPVEDHPPGECNFSFSKDWRYASLQNQIDQMGLHIQAMKVSVSPPKANIAHRTMYLACPYSHNRQVMRWMRTELATQVAAHLMSHDTVVFSPITHGHRLSEHLDPSIAHDHMFWMRQCLPFVEWANVFAVLPLYGWKESKGLQAELTLARSLDKEIVVLQVLGNPMCELIKPEDAKEFFGEHSFLEIV